MRPLPWQRLWVTTFALGWLLGAGLLGVPRALGASESPSSPERPRLRIDPYSLGDPSLAGDLEWILYLIPDLLAAELRESGLFDVVPPEQAADYAVAGELTGQSGGRLVVVHWVRDLHTQELLHITAKTLPSDLTLIEDLGSASREVAAWINSSLPGRPLPVRIIERVVEGPREARPSLEFTPELSLWAPLGDWQPHLNGGLGLGLNFWMPAEPEAWWRWGVPVRLRHLGTTEQAPAPLSALVLSAGLQGQVSWQPFPWLALEYQLGGLGVLVFGSGVTVWTWEAVTGPALTLLPQGPFLLRAGMDFSRLQVPDRPALTALHLRGALGVRF